MNKQNEDNIEVKIYDSIDEVDEQEWNSIVPENSILNSYGYLQAVEKSKVNNFYYKYLLFYRENKLIAHASTGVLTFYMDMMAGKGLKTFAAFMRKFFSSFFRITVIECGPSTGLGKSIVITDIELIPLVLERLDQELKKLARREKTSLIAIRDFYIHQKREIKPLTNLGYKSFYNLPNTFIKLIHPDFDHYLASFTSKRRREIKRRLDTFTGLGGTIEKIVDFAEYAPLLEKLWENTFHKSTEYQREILNSSYFSEMSDKLGEKSFILLCKVKDKPIGFTMFLDSSDTLISTYCGLDYEYTKEYYTYFILFYESIKRAIAMKKKWIELGITNYNPKMEAGALPEPMSVFAKSLNPLLNLFFVPLMSQSIRPPDFNKRSIFNKRKYERYEMQEKIPATLGHTRCQVQQISRGGLQIVSTEEFRKNKTLRIVLEIPGDFSLPLKVQIKNCRKEQGGVYVIGMQIKSKKISPQLDLLLSHYEEKDTV